MFVSVSAIYAQSDDQSKAILKELSEKTKGYTSLEANFTFSMLHKANGVDVSNSGTFQLKGAKYKVILGEQTIFCDGDSITTYKSETNEATKISEADLDMGELSPQNIFTIYESGFKSEYKSSKVKDGNTIVTVNLYPLQPKEKDYTIIRLEINKTKMELQKATVLGKDGTLYIYLVSGVTTNTITDETIFEFDPADYPGVTIIR